jgi:hypothetical protein
VADGVVVFDPDVGIVHYLNNTAATVFELCDGQSSIPTIHREVRSVFSDDSIAESVIKECLVDLMAKGLIV